MTPFTLTQPSLLSSLMLGSLLLLATPILMAQTCVAAITTNAPDWRYIDHGDGTITDQQTGLMWQQCIAGQSSSDCSGTGTTMPWDAALQYPDSLNVSGGLAGHTDWRLPNIKELASLVNKACYNPAINLTRFPNTPSTSYWSASPYAGSSYGAWRLNFYGGNVNGNSRNDGSLVRLVRGGQ